MSELVPVLTALVNEWEGGRRCGFCVVVDTRGSTPQSPGAALLVRDDRSTVGTLGGGCVEAEVVRRTHGEALVAGKSAHMQFLLNSDWGWDDGLICGGRMDIGVVVVTPHDDIAPFRDALERIDRREPAMLPIRFERNGSLVEYRIRLEQPPPLLIAGAGHIGCALARIATDLGFHVVVFDDRTDYANADRFGSHVDLVVGDIGHALEHYPVDKRCYIVIVTRGHKNDFRALEAVVERPARYIGLIGSKRKRKIIFDGLAAAGVSDSCLERVHSPVGLPIGAVTVPEIAVSIAAQLVQVRRSDPYRPVEGPFDFESARIASSPPLSE